MQGSNHDLITKIGKRGLRSQTVPISRHPRKAFSESKIPIFPVVPALYRNGYFFDSGHPFLGCLSLHALPLTVPPFLGTSDFQSEVGEVFSEIGGELPAKFGRRFSSFFAGENRQKHFPPKLHHKFHHQTSLRGSGLWRALPFHGMLTDPHLTYICKVKCSLQVMSSEQPPLLLQIVMRRREAQVDDRLEQDHFSSAGSFSA